LKKQNGIAKIATASWKMSRQRCSELLKEHVGE